MVIAPPADEGGPIHFGEFAKIPVVDHGRTKPMDTLARNALMVISSRQTFGDKGQPGQPAIQWLVDVMTSESRLFKEGRAEQHKVFRIENDQVLKFLNLEPRPEFYRYSLVEIAPQWEKFAKEAERVQEEDPKKLDLFEQKILELRQHIELYLALDQLIAPLSVPPANGDEECRSFFGLIH